MLTYFDYKNISLYEIFEAKSKLLSIIFLFNY